MAPKLLLDRGNFPLWKLAMKTRFSACLSFFAAAVISLADPSNAKFFKTPFGNETEYIESSILQDAAAMLLYAKGGQAGTIKMTIEGSGRAATPNRYVLELSGTSVPITLPANVPMWEPARYGPAVAQIAVALKLQRPAPTKLAQANLLRELESPRIETLAAVSLNLSMQLKKHMLEPALHEDVALLLAAFALRERLEPFDDLRWPLNRMAAHLAVGGWLSGGNPGLNGRYALAVAYTLMNLQTNALGRLSALKADPQGNPRWNRALYARITGDPRELTALPDNDLSLLEWAERISAVNRSSGAEQAAKHLAKFVTLNGERDLNSDFFFCVFQGYRPPSVGMGRALYLPLGLKITLRDVAQSWSSTQGSSLKLSDASRLGSSLNIEPGPCVRADGQIDVLDWGAWAMQSQRRLGTLYSRSLEFMRKQWGLLPNDIAEEQKQMDALLGELWLVPCVRGELGTAEQLGKAREIFAAHPQIVPMFSARRLLQAWSKDMPTVLRSDDVNFQSHMASLRWLGSGFPTGTFLGMEGTLPYVVGVYNLRDVLTQAPFSQALIRSYIQVNNPPPAELERVLRPIAEYSLYAGEMLAATIPSNQTAAKEAAYQKLAALDPANYLTLCRMFKKTDVAKAAYYFEKARTNGADVVGVSNDAGDFVLYYLSTGNRARAKQIAEEAEEVGSARGFDAMMSYCVKTHDYQRGLKSAQAQEERYGGHYSVPLFIEMVRKEQPGYHALDAVYDQKMAELLTKLFPLGITPYHSVPTAPDRGAQLEGTGRALRHGDVIVALDGKAVQSGDQLRYLRRQYTIRTGEAELIPMTVYRTGQYVDLKDTTADLRVADYTRSASPFIAIQSASASTQLTPPPPKTAPDRDLQNLRLNGISGSSSARLAIINGKTLAAGETAPVKLNGRSVTIRCVSISDKSAVVTIDGQSESKELTLQN
jgi:hypothetical protein